MLYLIHVLILSLLMDFTSMAIFPSLYITTIAYSTPLRCIHLQNEQLKNTTETSSVFLRVQPWLLITHVINHMYMWNMIIQASVTLSKTAAGGDSDNNLHTHTILLFQLIIPWLFGSSRLQYPDNLNISFNSLLIVYKVRCQSINQSLYFKTIVFKDEKLVGSLILGTNMLMSCGNLQYYRQSKTKVFKIRNNQNLR